MDTIIIGCTDRILSKKMIQAIRCNPSLTSNTQLILHLPRRSFFNNLHDSFLQGMQVFTSRENSHPLKECFSICSGKNILYVSDIVNTRDISVLVELLHIMDTQKKWLAIAPFIKDYFNRWVYTGGCMQSGLFYGSPYQAEVENKEEVERCDFLPPDCFVVRKNILRLLASERDMPYKNGLVPSCFMLDLCCHIKDAGYEIGCIPAVSVSLERLPKLLISNHKTIISHLFSEHNAYFAPMESFKARAVYFPSNWQFVSDKPDIVLLSHELNRTGAPIALLKMAAALKKLGFDVWLASCLDGEMRSEFLNLNIPILIDNQMTEGRFLDEKEIDLSAPLLVDNLVENSKYTVANSLVIYNLVIRYFGRPIPLVWWIHEGNTFWNSLADKLPLPADNVKLYVVSEYVKDVIKKYRPDYFCELLTICVDDEYSDYDMRTLKDEKDEQFRLLMAGTMQHIKGQDVLIRAVQRLPIEYQKRLEIYFAGLEAELPVVNYIKSFCNARDNAHYFGMLSKEELCALYRKSNAVVCPSRDDAVNMVAVEKAMLGGLIICSTRTGVSYMLEDGVDGFVFESENEQALMKTIKYLMDHYRELDTVKHEARKFYKKYFSNEVFEANIKKIFI